MSNVTLLWTVIATVALTLAFFCALAWTLDRRNLAYLMFCLTAVATAACTPFELGMMHAQTPAEFGEWLRGYHLPIFFVLVGQLLFVQFYLGTGRPWLLWTIIAWRLAILVTNFMVHPNFHFHEIQLLREVQFLGEPISVVGAGVPREGQWIAIASVVMLVVFVIDAAIRRWRKGGRDSRRRALVVGLGIGGPMICNLTLNQLAVFGVIHRPIFATLWFLGILAAVAYELGSQLIANARARLQVAQLRGELAQLGRIDTMGQLASGLAHELAQPLTASLGNIEAAQLHLRRPDPDLAELREILEDVHQDTRRAAEILDRMRSLIRRRALDQQPVSIDDVFRDVTSLLHSEAISRNIELKVRTSKDAPQALGDRVQMTQVLLNLVVNAMDALQISTSGHRQVLLQAEHAPGGGLEVSVADTGPGIPQQRLEEIFKPLFTTKPGSMGLGLALSRTIVEAHGGRLWAENRGPARGAVFRMTLPSA
jgi:signal transduction histidine kinase